MSVPARKILATFEPARWRKIQEQATKLIAEETERLAASNTRKAVPANVTASTPTTAEIDRDMPH